MRRTKLLQLGKYYHPVCGGMETFLYCLCVQLKDRFDVSVLASNTKLKTEVEFVDGINVTRLVNLGEVFSSPICPTSPYHLSKLSDKQDSIIHIHLPNPMAHLSYLIAKPGGCLIVTWHSDIIRQKMLVRFYDQYLLRLLERADCIVATSPNYVKNSQYLKKYSDKCVIVPLGINTQKFKRTATVLSGEKNIRKEYGNRIVLFVGRYAYYKGLENLLDAAKQIDATFLLIGDGPLRQSIAAKIRKEHLEGKVHLLHNISNKELVLFYHACDILVLPSNQRSEAFGVVQLEAMICGKPVISTDLKTGVPWVNQHGETGLVVPVNDTGRLAAAIKYLLDDEQERTRLGENAKQRVLENFTIEIVSRKMEQVYEDVLNGGVRSNLAKINY